MFTITLEKFIAERFCLPTDKFVNIERTLAYLEWLNTPEVRLESFLDSLVHPEREHCHA